jgi:hypothetical protein
VRILLLLIVGGLLAPAGAPPLTIRAAARAFQPGEVVVVTIRTGTAGSSVTGSAFGQDLMPFAVTATTWRAVAGIDLAVAPGRHEIVVRTADGRQLAYPVVVKPRTFPTRSLKVDPAFVTPPPEAAERIARETAELEAIWRATSPEPLWNGTFARPVPHAANSAFGTHSVFNGEPRSQHGGADFRSPAGTRIKAPAAGRVALASDRYFSGNTVVIDHGAGVFSLFAHLSRIGVKVGDVVERGAPIGMVDATGRVTGPHLHWSVRANGARVDPLSVLAVIGKRPKSLATGRRTPSGLPFGGFARTNDDERSSPHQPPQVHRSDRRNGIARRHVGARACRRAEPRQPGANGAHRRRKPRQPGRRLLPQAS